MRRSFVHLRVCFTASCRIILRQHQQHANLSDSWAVTKGLAQRLRLAIQQLIYPSLTKANLSNAPQAAAFFPKPFSVYF